MEKRELSPPLPTVNLLSDIYIYIFFLNHSCKFPSDFSPKISKKAEQMQQNNQAPNVKKEEVIN